MQRGRSCQAGVGTGKTSSSHARAMPTVGHLPKRRAAHRAAGVDGATSNIRKLSGQLDTGSMAILGRLDGFSFSFCWNLCVTEPGGRSGGNF